MRRLLSTMLAAVMLAGCASASTTTAVAPLTDPQARIAALEACDQEVPAGDRDTRHVTEKLYVVTLFPFLGLGAIFGPALAAGAQKAYESCLRERGYTAMPPAPRDRP